jgi:hypothetical protein
MRTFALRRAPFRYFGIHHPCPTLMAVLERRVPHRFHNIVTNQRRASISRQHSSHKRPQISVDIETRSALRIEVGDGLPCAHTCLDPREP